MLGTIVIFLVLFFSKRSRYINIYYLAIMLWGTINFIVNKTFFAPRDDLEVFDLYVSIYIFAVVPTFLLLLSALTFLNSKKLMQKEGKKVRNLFISIIGVASIIVLIFSIIIFQKESFLTVFDFIYYYILGLFLYFLILYSSTAMYALLCAWIPPHYEPEYIIVLGSGLIGDRVPPLLASRLDKAVTYYKKSGGKALLITSGGQGKNEWTSEAAAMKKYIVDKYHIAPDNIITEDKSTTTYENMLFSKEILSKHLGEKKGIFVTNNFHVLRASMYANQVKLKSIGVGSKTALYYIPNAFTREFIGILEMKKWWHITLIIFYTAFFLLLTRAYIN